MSLLCLFLVLLPLSIASSGRRSAPCSSLAKSPELNDPLRILNCLLTVKPDQQRMLSLLASIREAMTGYIYLDVVHANNETRAPLFAPVGDTMYEFDWVTCGENGPQFFGIDVLRELDDLVNQIRGNTGVFASDLDFVETLRDLFSGFCDPHTAYIPPACYLWQFVLPLRIVVQSDATSPSGVVVGTDNSTDVWHLFPHSVRTNLSSLLHFGSESSPPVKVLQIDGEDALSYLRRESLRSVFYSRNAEARFNQFISREFHSRTVARSDILRKVRDGRTSIRFRVQVDAAEVEVDVPWMGRRIDSMMFGFEKIEVLCGYEAATPESKVESVNNGMSNLKTRLMAGLMRYVVDSGLSSAGIEQAMIRRTNREEKQRNRRRGGVVASVSLSEMEDVDGFVRQELEYSDYDYFELFISKAEIGTKTAVLKVKTFMPDISLNDLQNPDSITDLDSILMPYSYYVLELVSAFNWTKIHRAERLIVDIRGNTGGIACFATSVLARMLSQYAPHDASPNGDLLVSDLGKSVHCRWNYFDKIANFGVDRKKVRGDWYNSGKKKKRGGFESSYSSLIHYGCQLALFLTQLDEDMWAKSPIQFEPEDLIILTDGTAGSAAGVFVKLFQYLGLARVVVHGGDPISGLDVPVASFSGAAVKTDFALLSEIALARFFCSDAKDLELGPFFGTTTFAFLELYPWEPYVGAFELEKGQDIVPLGYATRTPDARLNSWDFSANIYRKVVPFFDTCSDWEIQRDDRCSQFGSLKNAVYGHPCVNGQFDSSVDCLLRGCIGGFYLSEDRKECLAMPEEYDMIGWFISLILGGASLGIGLICCCCCCCCVCCCLCCYCCCCRKKKPVSSQEQAAQLAPPAVIAQGGTVRSSGGIRRNRHPGPSYELLPIEDGDSEDVAAAAPTSHPEGTFVLGDSEEELEDHDEGQTLL